MAKGKVKWFSAQKGFGFITKEDGKDVFVHHTKINMDGYRELKEGQAVSFDVEKTGKGDQAINVAAA